VKKTIAFYVVSTHLGGAERSLLELIEALKDTEYESIVILPKARGPLLTELKDRGVSHTVLVLPEILLTATRQRPLSSVFQVLLMSPSVAKYLRDLIHTLRKHRVDVVHTTGIKMHILGAWASRLARIRVLWHLRDILTERSVRLMLKATAAIARPKIIANSRATATSYGDNIEVLYNGINTEIFSPRSDTSSSADIRRIKDLPTVGICGVLAHWKGQSVFIGAAEIVLRQNRNVQFVIVGDEIYDTRGESGVRARLEEQIEKTGFSKSITIVGFHNDMPKVYNALDILIHASIKPEPFGRVIVEGMSCAVPVIASRDGGVTEIIYDGQDGLLFEPGDANDLAKKILHLLNDQDLRKRLGEAGRNKILSTFSFSIFRKRLLSLIREIA
jgi:glycosyltransferase involved in cell wall biosynthesis